MDLANLVFIGAGIQFIGGSIYVWETLKGRVQPNRMTFFLWSLAPLIGTVAAVIDGVGWAILPVFMAGFMPLLVLIASFFNKAAYWQLGTFDYYCGAFSLLALVFWAITQQPIVAIFLAATADGLAALPTLKKAWQFPETENVAPYITAFVAVALGLFAIEEWNPSEYLFSMYLLAITAAITLAIKRRSFFK